MSKDYDVIVVGLGAIGAASLYQLSKQGLSVLGLEAQAASPHNQGSSHGQTRLLRVAYQEGAYYVPLVRRAIELWRRLEAETGLSLFRQTGILYAGPEELPLISGSLSAAHHHDVRIEDWPEAATEMAFFDVPPDWQKIYEPDGGYLFIEDAITAMLKTAIEKGAETSFGKAATSIEKLDGRLNVSWQGGKASADAVIVTAGAWASSLLDFLTPYLRVERRTLHWYHWAEEQTPEGNILPFAFQLSEEGMFYGFPPIAGELKVASHSMAATEAVWPPEQIDREIHAEDHMPTDQFIKRHLPQLGSRRRSATCLYTMSPRGDFIIDEHPELPGVYFTAGLSGHGFKFATALGEIMASLATGTDLLTDIKPFKLSRLQA